MKTKIFLLAVLLFTYALNNAMFAQQLTANAGNDQTVCYGSSATLGGSPSATGGTPPYNYTWTPSTSLNNSTVANPTAASTTTTTYTLQVTDAAMNTATDDVIITVNPLPVANAGSDMTICMGMCVQLTATGGMTYNWSPAAGLNNPNISNPMTCPVTTTSYTVTVADAQGCTATDDVLIFVAGPINVGMSSTNASCGLCNGSATLSANGGMAPYTYVWSNGAIGPVQTTLCVGTYFVTITDATGCSASSAATITGGMGVSVVLDTLINANCTNNAMGSITVLGECGLAPYTYSWSNTQTTATITNLNVGTYSVTVIDANADSAIASFNISSTPNIYASIVTTNSNCGSNGTASVNVIGTSPPFTFEWSDSLHQTTATAIDLGPGHYTVTITDSLGCSIIGSTNIFSNCMNIIKGRVYYDLNQNCVQDSGEAGIQNVVIFCSPGYYYASTNNSGDYNLYTYNQNNIITISQMPPPYAITCPSSGSLAVNFNTQGDTSNHNDFGYYADPNYFDLSIHPGWTGANPGFEKKYWILYANDGAITQNATLDFTYDSLLQYDSCTQGGIHYPTQHKVEWILNNLQPGMYWDWNTKPEVYFHVPVSVGINTLLHSCFEILPVTGDANPSNNSLCSEETVTGSHDPNSKSVSPVGVGTEGFITQSDSTLLYTIHFQNDGNDTAFTVVVVDTLSPYLDPATLIPGASSHPYTFNLSGQGVITFRFDNILLPDSNVNEPASNGYVNYTVKQKKSNPNGTVITNTAAIYFDFNPAVNTNTVVSTLDYYLFVPENVSEQNNIKFYPNPAQDDFIIEISEKTSYPCKARIINDLANTVMTKQITQPITSINLKEIKSGIYFIIVEDSNGNIVGKGKMVKR